MEKTLQIDALQLKREIQDGIRQEYEGKDLAAIRAKRDEWLATDQGALAAWWRSLPKSDIASVRWPGPDAGH